MKEYLSLIFIALFLQGFSQSKDDNLFFLNSGVALGNYADFHVGLNIVTAEKLAARIEYSGAFRSAK